MQPEQPDRAGRAGRRDRDPAGRACRRRRCGRAAGTRRRPRRGVRRIRRHVAPRPARDLSEPGRGPDGEQGICPRRAQGRVRRRTARADRPAQPVPATGLCLDRVGHARHRGPARPGDPGSQPRPRHPRAVPADRRSPRARLVGRTVGHELHPGRLRHPGEGCARRGDAPVAWPRAAHVRGGSPARRPPAPDRPRPGRERSPHRRRPRGDPDNDDATEIAT